VRILSTGIADLQVHVVGVEVVVGVVATPDQDQGHADVGQEVGAVQEAAVAAAQEAVVDAILGGQEAVTTEDPEVAASLAVKVNQFNY